MAIKKAPGGNSVNRGIRSPMQGSTPSMKTPSLTGSGGGTVIPGSAPKAATVISSPNLSSKK